MAIRSRAAHRRRVEALRHALALDEPDADALLDQLEVRAMSSGEVLLRIGEPAGDAYVIVEGFVEIAAGDIARRHVHGIRMLRRGCLFGEMAILENRPRLASAVAQADGELIVLPAAVLQRLQDDRPEVRARLESQLRERKAQLAAAAR